VAGAGKKLHSLGLASAFVHHLRALMCDVLGLWHSVL
jgi:hypothetical protein